MCIAIANYKRTLSKKHLKNSWKNNDDGAGLLWVEKGKLKVYKQLTDFNAFYTKYIEIRSKIKTPIILHFRIGTHGVKNEDNLHPFICSEEVGFVHNGIISGWGNAIISDTNEYNNVILSKLPKGFEQNEASLYLIQESIGHSKLIFLNTRNEVSIVGEDLGHWVDDTWFSNESYKEINNYVWYGNVKKDKNPTSTKLTPREEEYNWWLEDDKKWENHSPLSSQIGTCDSCLSITEVELKSSTLLCKECVGIYANYF